MLGDAEVVDCELIVLVGYACGPTAKKGWICSSGHHQDGYGTWRAEEALTWAIFSPDSGTNYRLESLIPDSVKAELEQIKADIIAGKIKTKP